VIRYLLAGIAGFVLLTFIFRTPMTAWYLHHRIDRFNRENQATLAISM